MTTYTYKTKGVCSHSMTVKLEDGIIRDVRIEGGCNGGGRHCADAGHPLRRQAHLLPRSAVHRTDGGAGEGEAAVMK